MKRIIALLLGVLLSLGTCALAEPLAGEDDIPAPVGSNIFVEAGYRPLVRPGRGRHALGLGCWRVRPPGHGAFLFELYRSRGRTGGRGRSLRGLVPLPVPHGRWQRLRRGCNYDYGQLGDGSGHDRSLPIKVMDGAMQVVASHDFSAVLKTDGTLWTWGRNDAGQLGLGHTDTQTTPAQVALKTWRKSAAGDSFMVARTKDGSLYAWGDNTYGQIAGAGEASVPRATPARGYCWRAQRARGQQPRAGAARRRHTMHLGR